MARKHFDEYYNKICSQFFSLKEVFDDLSKEVADGMVEPERMEQLEKTIEPIKNSYQTLSYIKYLLDKPKRKQKEPNYKKQNKKLLALCEDKSAKDIIQKNDDILSAINK